jgi:CRISPR-associated endoribonuclease Cas6
MITRFVLTIEAIPEHPLYADAAYQIYAFLLEQLQEIRIENQSVPIRQRVCDRVGLEELLSKGRENCGRRAQLLFQTVTSFKQNGRYVLFPQERLILQSLMMRWNEAFPMCPLDDADAFQAMLAGIQIGDYNLRTSRFLLKGVRIPGFVGSCRMDVKLALPLQELWHTLLAFADYAGIGIKTGLGMGGVRVRYLDEKRMDVT